MNNIDKMLLKEIADLHKIPTGSYSIRKNGTCLSSNSTADIEIVPKLNRQGIDVYVKENVKNKSCHIPVIITKAGITEVVQNDFHISDGAEITIIAGCGISCSNDKSEHAGTHNFYVGNNCKVRYIEKHIGIGDEKAEKIFAPKTSIKLGKNSIFDMQTTQIGGVTRSIKTTAAQIGSNSKLNVTEKIMTTQNQFSSSKFTANLKGAHSSCDIVSRSVARDNSFQKFTSTLVGNNECFGHVECDGIILDNAKVWSSPCVKANHNMASLSHEAAIGKIAGEQLTKLMTLGLDLKEAEDVILKGFLS